MRTDSAPVLASLRASSTPKEILKNGGLTGLGRDPREAIRPRRNFGFSGLLGRALLVLLAVTVQAQAASLEVQYQLEAKLDAKLRQIEGSGRITLKNNGDQPLESCEVILYPDLYRTADPSLTWNERDLRYPRGWGEGKIELEIEGGALEVPSASAKPGEAAPLAPTRALLRLKSPLAPGLEQSIPVRFRTWLPKKRGPFGTLDGVVTLQAGWHPMIADGAVLPGRYSVKLEVPAGVIGTNTGALLPPESILPGWSASYSAKYKALVVGKLGHKVWAHPKRDKQLQRVAEALDEALQFYRERLGRPDAPPLEAAFGYLDQRLAAPGVGYLIVSDQVFRVMTLLGIFHTRALLDAAFETMLLRDFPELAARPWQIQFLAYGLRQQYFAEKFGLGKSLKDLIRGPLRLLPAFDELINGADFPGRQFYLHRIELESERQEDFFSHAELFPTGALLAERLGRLTGEEAVANLSTEYLKLPVPRPPLESFLEEKSSRELAWFFEQWLGPLRPMGMRIAAVRRTQIAGGWSTQIDIQRSGTRVDMLDVQVAAKGQKPAFTSVLLDEEAKTVTVETQGRSKRVTLDPKSQIEEEWRADNLVPARLKLLLYNSRVNLEPKSGQLDALFLLAFLREHDYKNLAFFELFIKPTRVGLSVDYAHQFGGAIDPLRYPFTLRAGVGFERTKADEETGEPALNITTIRAGAQYDTSNYLSEVDQKNDSLLDLLLEAAPGGFVSETSFLQSRLTAARYQRLNGGIVAAGRLLLGLSFGDLPSNRRFDLGNANGMRGFAARDILAENVAMVNVELRTDVLRNFDFAFPWGLAFLHRLQLVTFMDGVLASDTRDLFSEGETSLNVGAGVRLHGRWFGIMPSMGKIDVGFPVRGGEEEGGVRIYLGLTQSF